MSRHKLVGLTVPRGVLVLASLNATDPSAVMSNPGCTVAVIVTDPVELTELAELDRSVTVGRPPLANAGVATMPSATSAMVVMTPSRTCLRPTAKK
jgi:hypothetical protein